MKRIALTRTALVLGGLITVVCYSYIKFNLFVAVVAGVSWWLIWTVYCNWIHKRQRLEVEKYIKDFSTSEDSLQEYHQVLNFIYNRDQCDGFMSLYESGIHLRLDSAYKISWRNVKGITLIDGYNVTLARLFFLSDDGIKDRLIITWDDSFNDKIPNSVHFIDSRK